MRMAALCPFGEENLLFNFYFFFPKFILAFPIFRGLYKVLVRVGRDYSV